jgi:hypothetical protein
MSQEYTLIGDLNNGNMYNQGQMQAFGMQPPPPHPPPNQIDMINKYLEDTDTHSSSDSSDDESDDNDSNLNWRYFYNIIVLIMLAVILYYVWKIRRELVGIYEE